MNSKYKEVPRYNAALNHVPRTGVSSAAIANAREQEQARQEALVAETGTAKCVWTAIGALYLAVLLDGAAWATTGWGVSNKNDDGVSVQIGLWQICTTTIVLPQDPETAGDTHNQRLPSGDVSTYECVFPTSVSRDWIHKALVMEIMGGFCGLALFFCLAVLLANIKCSFFQTKTTVITLIPLAFLAALMNLIGLLMISLNLSTMNCHPSYSVALDILGVVSYSLGGACALMDIQDCFAEPSEEPTDLILPLTRRHPLGLTVVAR